MILICQKKTTIGAIIINPSAFRLNILKIVVIFLSSFELANTLQVVYYIATTAK